MNNLLPVLNNCDICDDSLWKPCVLFTSFITAEDQCRIVVILLQSCDDLACMLLCCSNMESQELFSDIDGMLLGLTAELDEMLKLQG